MAVLSPAAVRTRIRRHPRGRVARSRRSTPGGSSGFRSPEGTAITGRPVIPSESRLPLSRRAGAVTHRPSSAIRTHAASKGTPPFRIARPAPAVPRAHRASAAGQGTPRRSAQSAPPQSVSPAASTSGAVRSDRFPKAAKAIPAAAAATAGTLRSHSGPICAATAYAAPPRAASAQRTGRKGRRPKRAASSSVSMFIQKLMSAYASPRTRIPFRLRRQDTPLPGAEPSNQSAKNAVCRVASFPSFPEIS